MRYRLRTLLILMAVGPPVLASAWIFWGITWRVLVLLAIPVIFAGAIVVAGMALCIPLIVVFELAFDLHRLTNKGRKSDS